MSSFVVLLLWTAARFQSEGKKGGQLGDISGDDTLLLSLLSPPQNEGSYVWCPLNRPDRNAATWLTRGGKEDWLDHALPSDTLFSRMQ
jgi:hypothetical protein